MKHLKKKICYLHRSIPPCCSRLRLWYQEARMRHYQLKLKAELLRQVAFMISDLIEHARAVLSTISRTHCISVKISAQSPWHLNNVTLMTCFLMVAHKGRHPFGHSFNLRTRLNFLMFPNKYHSEKYEDQRWVDVDSLTPPTGICILEICVFLLGEVWCLETKLISSWGIFDTPASLYTTTWGCAKLNRKTLSPEDIMELCY